MVPKEKVFSLVYINSTFSSFEMLQWIQMFHKIIVVLILHTDSGVQQEGFGLTAVANLFLYKSPMLRVQCCQVFVS